MNEVVRKETLTQKLDRIAEEVREKAVDGYYTMALAKKLGMWDSGEAVAGVFRGVKTPPTYRQLERDTGREHKALKRWHEVYQQNPSRKKYLAVAKQEALEWARKALEKNTIHVSLNSGESEWYTPDEYINAARSVMGSIDVDPATTKEVNKRIKAKTFYTVDNSGLDELWRGNVWLNPPYSQPLVTQFCQAFAEKFQSGEMTQGCLLTNNATETGHLQDVFQVASAMCFPRGRIQFWDSSEEPKQSPLQGQVIIYCGSKAKKFAAGFKEVGVCVFPAK